MIVPFGLYTIGGSEWFHKFKGHLGYKVIKYPLNLVGIYNIKRFYIDNLNKSNAQSISNKVEKIVNQVTKLVD